MSSSPVPPMAFSKPVIVSLAVPEISAPVAVFAATSPAVGLIGVSSCATVSRLIARNRSQHSHRKYRCLPRL